MFGRIAKSLWYQIQELLRLCPQHWFGRFLRIAPSNVQSVHFGHAPSDQWPHGRRHNRCGRQRDAGHILVGQSIQEYAIQAGRESVALQQLNVARLSRSIDQQVGFVAIDADEHYVGSDFG